MRTSLLAGLLHSGLSDLTNTTWTFSATPSLQPDGTEYAINFTCNDGSQTYTNTKLSFDKDYTWLYMIYAGGTNHSSYGWACVYWDGQWTWNNDNTAIRTITITGGTDATNATLIAWLQANATQTA